MSRRVACKSRRVWGKLERLSSRAGSLPIDASAGSGGPDRAIEVCRLFMDDDGTFPNNSQYPVLIYKSAFEGSRSEGARRITAQNRWTQPWAWGIFTYHHYHSGQWELLLCVQGAADVQLGGEAGPTVELERGDLVLIPPGFAHKQLHATGGFTLLGSYPVEDRAGSVDTLTGPPSEEERRNIANCPVPGFDTILGLDIVALCQSHDIIE